MRKRNIKKEMLIGTLIILIFNISGICCGAETNGIKMYVISSGELTIPKSFLTGFDGVGENITIPIPTYLIEHQMGNVLVDTGMRCDNKPEKITKEWYCKDANLIEHLKEIGHTPNDIKFVVMTHLHIDHAGYMDSFPNATFFIQKDEMSAIISPLSFEKRNYWPIDFKKFRDLDIVQLEGDWDLFGDGSVKIFKTSGHSRGHQSVIVKLPKTGSVILTGDAVYLPEIMTGTLPGILWNAEEFSKSVQRVKLEKDRNKAKIFYSHDPEQFKTLKLAPEYYE